MGNYHDYAGVIHIHSSYSDGLREVPEITAAAGEAGCDYMVLSDHDTLKALPREGWYGRTALLVGEEISTGIDQGHFLAARLTSVIPPGQSPQETIHQVAAQGGLGFITHPFSKGQRNLFNLTPEPWQDWQVTGIRGLEIWNYSQDWKENFGGFWTFLQGLLCPESFIDGPLPETLQKWDELLQRLHVTGIGSVDAHGYFYSYQRMFRTLRTHILTEVALSYQPEQFEQDKSLIYTALQRGNCYFSHDSLAPAKGFMYGADNGRLEVTMGEEIRLEPEVTIKISSPRKGLLRIVRDGQVVTSATGANRLVKAVREPGAYRAEVYLRGFSGFRRTLRPWIFSNPVYVSSF